jgi:hypothetical protein
MEPTMSELQREQPDLIPRKRMQVLLTFDVRADALDVVGEELIAANIAEHVEHEFGSDFGDWFGAADDDADRECEPPLLGSVNYQCKVTSL